jgi:autotransporter-associated beta strand protein
LSLNSSTSNGQPVISVQQGSHLISAPVYAYQTAVMDVFSGVYDGTNSRSGTLMVSGAIGGAGSAGLIKRGAGTLILSGTNTYTGDTTIERGKLSVSSSANFGSSTNKIRFAGGTLLTTASISTNRHVYVHGGGGTIDSNGYSSTLGVVGAPTGEVAGNLLKVGTGILNVAGIEVANLQIDGGRIAVQPRSVTGGNSVVRVRSLSVGSSQALDLNDNDLVVDYTGSTTFSDIRDLRNNGYSASANSTIAGIISSTSQNISGAAILSLVDNALLGASEWPPGSGKAVDATSVIGKYTYRGDADWDGQVTGDDYGVIDATINTTPLAGIAEMAGDLNLDGEVTNDDYGVIDAGLGNGVGNPLAPASFAVPEPAIPMILVPSLALLRRRRSDQGSRS